VIALVSDGICYVDISGVAWAETRVDSNFFRYPPGGYLRYKKVSSRLTAKISDGRNLGIEELFQPISDVGNHVQYVHSADTYLEQLSFPIE
jgi:hypothetical protein